MTPAEIQNTFETELTAVTGKLVGRGAEEDWALIRALVHKAVHIAAERRGDYCAISLLFAEMLQHSHQLMHATSHAHTH
jgi:hypothetical protein